MRMGSGAMHTLRKVKDQHRSKLQGNFFVVGWLYLLPGSEG